MVPGPFHFQIADQSIVMDHYAPDHKTALCYGLSVGVRKHWFPSIIGETPVSIDPIFLWLISATANPIWALRPPQDKHSGHKTNTVTIWQGE
jgi:hypothetical protein